MTPTEPSLGRLAIRWSCAGGRALWGHLPRRARWALVAAAVVSTLGAAVRHHLHTRPPTVPGVPAPRRPVAIVEVSDRAHRERAAALARASLTPAVLCRRRGMADLGLVTSLEPQLGFTQSGLLDQALGREAIVLALYMPGRDTILVTSARRALAHEWVHAIEDQYAARMLRAARDETTTDERIALRAAIEGTAVAAIGGRSLTAGRFRSLDDAAWFLAYESGPGYIRERAGGSALAAFALAPQSVHEVLYGGGMPQEVSPSPTPGELVCTDRLGVTALLVVLERAGVPPGAARSLARAWRGDRLEVRTQGAARTVSWAVLFEDALSADQWAMSVGRTLPGAALTRDTTGALTHISVRE